MEKNFYRPSKFEIPKLKEVSRDDFWFPEHLTPFFHLKAYGELPFAVRRRYNQLYALAVNEIFSYFENHFIRPIVGSLLTRVDEPLRSALAQFCDEEEKHAEMFAQLNRVAEPRLYAHREFFFCTQNNLLSLLALKLVRSLPQFFGVWIWISIYFEEKTLLYSGAFNKGQNLNPVFRNVHHLHLLEEVGHVQLDELLVEKFYSKLSLFKRRLAARMFLGVVKRFARPRKMSRTIASVLRAEFPEHITAIDGCIDCLPQLDTHHGFQNLYFGPTAAPRTFRLMRKFPEMAQVLTWLEGLTNSRQSARTP